MLDKDDYQMLSDALDVLEGSAKTSRMLVGMMSAGMSDNAQEAKKHLKGVLNVSDEECGKEDVLREKIILLKAKLINMRNDDLVKAANEHSISQGGG